MQNWKFIVIGLISDATQNSQKMSCELWIESKITSQLLGVDVTKAIVFKLV